jgi:cellulose synthase/poly-beta-1,6-N-acetylglucosamine synthase-like glycosyltransferase
VAETLFWVLVALLVWLHGGYAIALALAARLGIGGGRAAGGASGEPKVAVVVGAFNEEAVIGAKLESLLDQDYDGELEIVVASDRSSDDTDRIVGGYAQRGVRLEVAPRRRGKAANISAIVPTLDAPIVVCTDAGGRFAPDVVRRLVRGLDDPRAGLVGGRVVYRNVDASGVSRGEGLYWRYEVMLRTLESRTGGTVIVSGACYAIRRELFRDVPSALPDDFMSPLHVWDQGYRVLYDPLARIDEEVATTVQGEFRTKTRIISRNAAALWKMRHLLSPARPALSVKLLSHRLLRWLVVPVLLLVALLNAMLVGRPFYTGLLGAQAAFWTLGALGLVPRLREWRAVYVAFYFWLVNLAAFVGVVRALTGRISGTWEPVERER